MGVIGAIEIWVENAEEDALSLPTPEPKEYIGFFFFLVSIDAWMNLIRLDLAIWSNQWIVSDQIVSFNYLVTRYMPIIVIVVTVYDLFFSVLFGFVSFNGIYPIS